MNDEERQRTMDFILQQQAQFAVGMQRLEKADARASLRLDRLERTVVLMARQFRRERRDLRERIAALVDSQIMTEEITRQNSEAIRQNSDAISALTKTLADKSRNGNDNGDASK